MGKGEGSKARLPFPPSNTLLPWRIVGGWVGRAPAPDSPSSVSPSYRTQDGSEFLLQAKDEVRSGPFSPLSGPQEQPGWLVSGPE